MVGYSEKILRGCWAYGKQETPGKLRVILATGKNQEIPKIFYIFFSIVFCSFRC